MSTFDDAQRDAADLAKLVNEDGYVETRYGDNPKRSWQKLQDDFDTTEVGGFVAQSVAAADRAELAADVAMSAGWVYPDVASGETARTDGDYFWVVSADESETLELWVMGATTATDTGKRTVASKAVLQPDWAGKLNGWPDPFFRYLTPYTALAEYKSRAVYKRISGTNTGAFTVVENSLFNGNALRRPSDLGGSNLGGPRIYYDEINAVTGDTVTVKMLVISSSPSTNVQASLQQVSDSDTLVGGAVFAPAANVGSTPTLITASVTVDSLANQVVATASTSTASVTFDIVALWAIKGTASESPDWPTLYIEDIKRTEQLLDLIKYKWAGKLNAWPDPFFRSLKPYDATLQYEGRPTYRRVSGINTGAFTIVDNTIFDGGSLRRPADLGSGNLGGPRFYFDKAGITGGDKVTVKFIVSASADSTDIIFNMNQVNSSDAIVGSPITLPTITAGLEETLVTATLTADALANQVILYGYTNASGVTFDIHAIWVCRGAADESPDLPTLLVEDVNQQNQIADIDTRVTSIESQLDGTIDVVAAPTFYGVQGRQANLYFDNLLLQDASDYNFDVEDVGQGTHFSECWRWTPDGAVSSTSFDINAYDKFSAENIGTATTNIISAASSAGTGLTKTALFIGDSLTAAGVYTEELVNIATSDVMDISLIGTLGTAPNLHEGRGGWTVTDYIGAGRPTWTVTVTGVVDEPVEAVSQYSNNGSVFKVGSVNLSGGAGTLQLSRVSGSNAPTSPSGTLTKVSGDGDATISYSAVDEYGGNPFWSGSSVDFAGYLNDNNFSAPDFVFIMLGINDCFGQTTDAGAESVAISQLNSLDTLINSIKSADANTKVVLMTPTPPSAYQDSFGINYASGQTRWRQKRNIMIWNKTLIAKYAGEESSRIYIAPTHMVLDTVNNMRWANANPANSRTSRTIERQLNGVHPADSGYYQIADCVWAFIKNTV